MRYQIRHCIRYFYTEPVFFEPLIVRLQPRCNSIQQVSQFDLDVEPTYKGSADCIDLDGNNISVLWFDGLHDYLVISANSQVETLMENPFNFVVTESTALKLPVKYSKDYFDVLTPYIMRRHTSFQIDAFIEPIITKTSGDTISFLIELATLIHTKFSREVRETGPPKPPDETLANYQGACRDLALLFVEGCRAVGLAARFVSGYKWGDNSFEEHHLHAWAEVFLPGGGWRGFDPSTGLAVSNHHVAIAAAAVPNNAAPTSGNFRGTGIKSKLEYDVSICPSQGNPSS